MKAEFQGFGNCNRAETVKLKPSGYRVEPTPAFSGRIVQHSGIYQEKVGGEIYMWDTIFTKQNLLKALKRVEMNKGAAGSDGMTTKELRKYLRDNWKDIKAKLDQGEYPEFRKKPQIFHFS